MAMMIYSMLSSKYSSSMEVKKMKKTISFVVFTILISFNGVFGVVKSVHRYSAGRIAGGKGNGVVAVALEGVGHGCQTDA